MNFGNQSVRITDKRTNKTVARGRAREGLYELTVCTSDRALLSQAVSKDSQATSEGSPKAYGMDNASRVLTDLVRSQLRLSGSQEIPPADFELMHQRLGHPGAYRLKDLHLFAEGVEAFDVPKNYRCDVCDASKMVRTINKEPRTKTTVPGARMHTDFAGPYPVGSIIGGYKMFVALIDEATGRAEAKPFASKSEVKGFLIHNCRSLIMEDHRPVLFVRTDNAKEYIATENELQSMGVTIEFTTAYHQYQNGISERFNRTIITIARSMLVQSGLPLSFWAEAFMYACYIYNKLPQQGTRGRKSPDEQWYGKKPDLARVRVFGCVCRVYQAKEQRVSKLSAVNYLGIYTGYHSSTQYRVYRPDKNRFDWPTNVTFYEYRRGVELLPAHRLPKFESLRAEATAMTPEGTQDPYGFDDDKDEYSSSDDDDQHEAGGLTAVTSPSPNINKNTMNGDTVPRGDISPSAPRAPNSMGEDPQIGPRGPTAEGVSPPALSQNTDITENLTTFPTVINESAPAATTVPASTSQSLPATRRSVEPTAASSRPQRARRAANNVNFQETFGLMSRDHVLVAHLRIEPLTYQEAINGPDSREWKLAIIREITALIANAIWFLSDLPQGRRTVTCKWVFKIKYNPDGIIDKYKARLVARGFTQVENIDFHETFAPTLRFESLRLLFAFAVQHGLLIH